MVDPLSRLRDLNKLTLHLDCFITSLWYEFPSFFSVISWEPLELEASEFMNSVSAGFQTPYNIVQP